MAHPQSSERGTRWVVKDPVSLSYFHLCKEEFAIFEMLDGETSIDEIRMRFERRFPPRTLDFRHLQEFLGRLHREGLLLVDAPGQAEQLLERRSRRRSDRLASAMTNLLAIRFPGIDPERFLQWLYPRMQWVFSSWFMALGAALILSAAGLTLFEFEGMRRRLPEFHAFFNLHNAVGLAIAVGLAKALHELAHALICKHLGGECHEVGLMLLFFAPCLYCDVSDAWTFPNRWHRVAVSAAGICLEVLLASICAWLWWLSEPGPLNSLCLNLMFVCSVSTLIINGNPLLRYDGYYIATDLLEQPNLGQQATAVLRRSLADWCLGLEFHADLAVTAIRRSWLAAYAIAAASYRWFVAIGAIWFLHKTMQPYRLEFLAQVALGLMLAQFLVLPGYQLLGFVRSPVTRARVSWPRFLASLACGIVIVAIMALIPLPMRIESPAVLEPEHAQRAYVFVPGTLVEAVRPGDVVAAGQILARLKDPLLDADLARLRGERDRQRLHIDGLERRRVQEPAAGAEIPAAREALADLDERLAQREADRERLNVRAQRAGTVLPPPLMPESKAETDELPAWTGIPLDPCNHGCYLNTGSLLCLVGDPSPLAAQLVIDQSDVELVQTGQRVRIKLDELPAAVLWGTITDLAKIDLKRAPRELAGSDDLPTRRDDRGVSRILNASYEARVKLDPHEYRLLVAARGRAKIEATPRSPGWRLARYLSRTIRVDLAP